jgi:hypothetical protein
LDALRIRFDEVGPARRGDRRQRGRAAGPPHARPAWHAPDGSEVLPAWAILEATSEDPEATFRLREAGIPFEVTVAEAITPAGTLLWPDTRFSTNLPTCRPR